MRRSTAPSVVARTSARGLTPAAPVDFTEAWLRNRRLSEHTRAAYRRDIAGWLTWCSGADLDPLRATFLDVNGFARALEASVDPRTGRLLTPATVARKLSALSSWYAFLVRLRAVPANPVTDADRPRVNRDHSATLGLTPDQVDALFTAAHADRKPSAPRTVAVLALLADLGLRVGELVSLDVADLGHERAHRSVRFTGKGGRARRRALAPDTAAVVDHYLAVRARDQRVPVEELTGPLLVTATGARLDRHAVFRMIRRLARDAGLPAWDRLSPHSLRHAFATTARAEGVPLEDVQDAMGHADPRTTRRYDRDRHNLDRDPAYRIAAARAARAAGG
ncbi:tyrosine-type recombinase/integrase [Solwaraspora sp. WMMD406]|uniref:tyrosine-type recombinase/integrase n=1 Tax=Solwaraspora sp. WMMD406 TaxID=3016095 RepID=UPI002416A9CF|nr:tyrosine-type recombinase/integrase [Solwaraspora sp. WMMD406]MDG4766184.1 tyrosine-type recombinase/integrase [Solwaraspora sp. WMMD406]